MGGRLGRAAGSAAGARDRRAHHGTGSGIQSEREMGSLPLGATRAGWFGVCQFPARIRERRRMDAVRVKRNEMRHFNIDSGFAFERAVVVISLDAEQIWGYLDLLDERAFCQRYPNVANAYEGLLDRFCAAGISATWALVGGLSLDGMEGPRDARLTGLPRDWIASIPNGTEAISPLWYRRSFVRTLKAAYPQQEVALHGGLTHLIWNDPCATADAIERELAGGVKALAEISVRPRSFIYPRQGIARLELLPAYGISCYRGNAPAW